MKGNAMLKRLIYSFLLVISLMPIHINAQSFMEGEHYIEVENFDTSKKQIIEFFSFYCPACYGQEPLFQDIKKSLPNEVAFHRNHISGMPGRNEAIEDLLTKASLVAKHFDVEDQVISAIFERIHKDRGDITGVDDVKAIFVKQGIAEGDFNRIFKGFAINVQLKKKQQNTVKIREQGHSAVPTLVINGKYIPITRSIKTLDEYKNLINYLVNKA